MPITKKLEEGRKIKQMSSIVCMRTSVCVCEREREREGQPMIGETSECIYVWHKAMISEQGYM